MPRLGLICVLACSASLFSSRGPSARAEELSEKQREVVRRGLEWLKKQQFRDGHWEASGGQFSTAMTGLAGTAFLMEGSTIKEGKYSEVIRRAVDYCFQHSQHSGLIGEINAPNQGLGYLYGHGYSMLFLAHVYGEEDDADRRRKLEDLLNRAVDFSCKSQTTRGGWGYVSAKDGNDFDEGSVSITQVQALRACRNAGIVVPKEAIDKVQKYLKDCTTTNGGLIYSLASGYGGGERPTITVAGIASMFSAGEYNNPLAKKWLAYVRPVVPVDTVGQDQFGHSEYTHYYYAQVIYCLGEDGYAKMFPDSKPSERLTWSKYRKHFYEFLTKTQLPEGNWRGVPIGPVYTACCYLTILQLEKGALPIYQR
jgi:hypothetical protein